MNPARVDRDGIAIDQHVVDGNPVQRAECQRVGNTGAVHCIVLTPRRSLPFKQGPNLAALQTVWPTLHFGLRPLSLALAMTWTTTSTTWPRWRLTTVPVLVIHGNEN